jgi:diguanylate cyclase (GGDEF)-like protein
VAAPVPSRPQRLLAALQLVAGLLLLAEGWVWVSALQLSGAGGGHAPHTAHLWLDGVLMLGTVLLLVVLLRRLHLALGTAQTASERQQAVFDALPYGLVLWDAQGRLEAANADFRRLYEPALGPLEQGMAFEAMLDRLLAAGRIPVPAGERDAWRAMRLQEHARGDGSSHLRRMPDGRWRQISEQRLADGRLLGHSVDVTALVEREHALQALNQRLDGANAELRRLSETDSLTGLANRRRFDHHLADEVARARRHGLPLALLMLDIDHFKRFNDLHGHPAGDACLARVGALLQAQAQRPADLAARLGGEEFALLLPHTGAAQALQHAQGLREALAALALPHGASPTAPHLTVSIGLACWQHDQGGAALVAAADAALYAAKQAGRDRVVADAAAAAALPTRAGGAG